jgi:UPF0716 protein FxsA
MLLIVPILEISVFILVGSEIGLWATLGFILLTAIIGTILLRWQGLATVNRLRNEFASGQMPARTMGDGAMLLVAGVLLLTPGFVTDTIGFSLFIPAVRSAIFGFFAKRVTVASAMSGSSAHHRADPHTSRGPFGHGQTSRNAASGQDKVIDLDDDDFQHREPDPNTPWRGKSDEGTQDDSNKP